MTDHKYHSVLPTSNNLNGFQANDNIEFLLDGDGRALVSNSIYIDFQLDVYSTGATQVAAADDLVLNERVAAQSVFESFTTEVQQNGIIENLQSYARFVNIHSLSTKSDFSMQTSSDAAQGSFVFRENGKYACQQNAVQNTTVAQQYRSKHYSIKPKICLNRAQGGQYEFDKNGYIKISSTLSKINNVLSGAYIATTDYSYQISNVHLRYQTIPADQAVKSQMLMNSYVSIKQSLTSTNNSINAVVPSKSVSGCTISFLEQLHENKLLNDSLSCEVLPEKLSSIRFLFNSTLNERIAYELTDIDEIQEQAVNALSESGINGCSRQKMKANKGFLAGLDFKQYLDLSSTSFTMNINTENSLNAEPVNAYIYFHTLVSV